MPNALDVPRRHGFALLVALAAMLPSHRATAQNIIVNAGFEASPPTTFGNHVNHSIAPWLLTGNQPNVVRVDGPGGFNYGASGPQSDAAAPGAGTPQHYLDIVGSATLYQNFTPQCSGQVTFGGAFSTRDNVAGTGSVRIVAGTTPSGTTVGTSQAVNLPAGNSTTAPWQTVSSSVPVTAGTTYSFVVTMDNNVNFDNAFVTYNTPCGPAADPCCPPFNETVLQQRLFYQGTGSLSAPYTVNFQSNATLNSQMQAYVNYLATLGLGINSLTVTFSLHPSGTGAAPGAPGAQQGAAFPVIWTAGGSAPSIPSFFPAGSMQVGTWYTVKTVMSLNNGIQFIPANCVENSVAMRVQFVPGAPQGGQGEPGRGQASPLQFYERRTRR